MRRYPALLVLAVFSAGCRAPANSSAPILAPCPAPAVDVSRWELVDRRTFAFRLPPGFRQVPVQGIDSHVEQFEADGGMSVISFDLGWYSNDLSHVPDMYSQYDRCAEVVGGRRATIITGIIRNPNSSRQDGRQLAAAAWRNLRDQPDSVPGHEHLTIWGETRDRGRLRQLLAMLRTVEFARRDTTAP